MARRIPDETKQLMRKMYEEGISIKEIARRTNVSYPTAWGYTEAREKGFSSYAEYQEHLAKQRGFSSSAEYQEHLAKQRGFSSSAEYKNYSIKQRGFSSHAEYIKHLAKTMGFSSYAEYQEDCRRKKQQKPENQKLSDLIIKRLKELKKNQNWLAKQVGVTRQSISLYKLGKITPSEEILRSLFFTLNVPYQTLEDLV